MAVTSSGNDVPRWRAISFKPDQNGPD